MSLKTQRLLIRAKKLIKNNDLDSAKEIYLSILSSYPKNHEAKKGWSILQKIYTSQELSEKLQELINLYKSGSVNETLAKIDKLIVDYPNEAFLFNLSGACYTELGDIESAIKNFKIAISLKPDYSEAQYNLGVAYQKTNHHDNAIRAYEDAISNKHAYPTAHNNLGLLYLATGLHTKALSHFEWATAYNPDYYEAYNSTGAALQELKQFTKAKDAFLKSTNINPSYSQGFHNLAILCEIINLKDEASKYYKKALDLDPNFAEAYRNQSRTKKFKKKDPQITQMLSLYSKDDLGISEKIHICFALAKVYEDLGNKKNYFKFLNEGNQLRKIQLNYDINESIEFQKNLLLLFSKKFPQIKKQSNKSLEKKPIFIVGMPRSGTSLVEQIISSHSLVYGAGELNNLKKIVTPVLQDYFLGRINKISEESLLSIRKTYIESIKNLNTTEKIITDKMPVNFRLIGIILTAIPEAKIIHLTRDARATCWSNYKHYFANENGFAFNQEDLAKFYILYTELMQFWHKLFPNSIYDLNYETLTKNQEKETRKLLKYCNLDWDKKCIDFHNNKRAVQTASASQVRKKMYQDSSEAWKEYESYLKPLIDGLKNYSEEIN